MNDDDMKREANNFSLATYQALEETYAGLSKEKKMDLYLNIFNQCLLNVLIRYVKVTHLFEAVELSFSQLRENVTNYLNHLDKNSDAT